MSKESEQLTEIIAQNEELIAISLAKNPPKYMNVRHVALILGCSKKTVNNRISEGYYVKMKHLVLWKSVMEYEKIFERRLKAQERKPSVVAESYESNNKLTLKE